MLIKNLSRFALDLARGVAFDWEVAGFFDDAPWHRDERRAFESAALASLTRDDYV
jgi:hypothetical protein